MALDPSDAVTIAQALAQILLPVNAFTLGLAMFWSFVMAAKVAAPKAVKLWRKEAKDPESELNKMRAAELQAVADKFGAMMDEKIKSIKFPEAPESLDKLVKGYNETLVPLMQALDSQLSDAHLTELMGNVLSKHRAAAKARGDGDLGTQSDLEKAAENAAWAGANPDQAQALAAAHSGIDGLAPVFNWDEAKVAKLHKQANEMAAAGGNVKAFVDKLQGGSLLGGSGGGGGQSGGGARRIGT